MAVSDDDDDGSIGLGDCEADGRIVIMIPGEKNEFIIFKKNIEGKMNV